jgi:glycosyltransferase involved in cell wall biosynthesis
MSKFTICIKTFERPEALRLLVYGIRRAYPDVRILVADDSENPEPLETVEYFPMPFDSGLSAGRNLLLSQVNTPYVVFLDDDFVFSEDTKLERLQEDLDKHSDIDLVAGMVTVNGKETHYEGILVAEGDVLHGRRETRGVIDGLPLYDVVYNFFMARVDKLRLVPWDNNLKLAEHTEFCLRAKGKLTIAYDETVKVENSRAEYNDNKSSYRGRGLDYLKIAMEKHGFSSYINFEGREVV